VLGSSRRSHAALALLWSSAPTAGAPDVILVPHAQTVQEAAGSIGQAPPRLDASGVKIRQQAASRLSHRRNAGRLAARRTIRLRLVGVPNRFRYDAVGDISRHHGWVKLFSVAAALVGEVLPTAGITG
jgi:hypothetical protein